MLVNDVKLEKCPFCGGKAKIHLYLSKYYANCKKCKTYSAPYDTPEEAAAAWNTRYYTAGVDLETMQTYYEQKEEEKHKNPLNVNFDNMEEASEM